MVEYRMRIWFAPDDGDDDGDVNSDYFWTEWDELMTPSLMYVDSADEIEFREVASAFS